MAAHLQEGAYFCRAVATVPPDYPESMADVTIEDSNLPAALIPEVILRMKVGSVLVTAPLLRGRIEARMSVCYVCRLALSGFFALP